MPESILTPSEHLGPGPQPGNFFDNQEEPSGLVTVSSGPYVARLPVSNTSVGEIRRRFGGRFDIDPQGQAVLDGCDVGDQVIVRPGQALMFTRRAGEKGISS